MPEMEGGKDAGGDVPVSTALLELRQCIGGCEWSARFEPVPGWDAIPTTRTVSGKFVEKSFSVRACPKFRRG